jgi:hypothetical protein
MSQSAARFISDGRDASRHSDVSKAVQGRSVIKWLEATRMRMVCCTDREVLGSDLGCVVMIQHRVVICNSSVA